MSRYYQYNAEWNRNVRIHLANVVKFDIFLKFYCEVTTYGAAHSGSVGVYDHTGYHCLGVGSYHFFCQLHHQQSKQQRHCPKHSWGWRLK